MEHTYFDYIIVGAGPAGLQTGYFLDKRTRNYCILERAENAGSFFSKFPRQRNLISINKIYTGYSDPEVNLRWDWNSLLSDSPDLLFKNYSKDYFPHSDDLVRYLKDFSEHHGLNIQYKTEVKTIEKTGDGLFHILTSKGGYHCKNLIMATGIPQQYVPDIEGIEHCEPYSECSISADDYVDKRVLIVGKGNSGFELADLLVATASRIHLISPKNISFAWKTHYVGNLRAVNNNLLDTYLLKSQNAILNAHLQRIVKQEDGTFLATVDYTKVRGGELEEFEYDKVILACGFQMDASIFGENAKPRLTHSDKLPDLSPEWESTNVANLFFAGALSHSLDYKKSTSGFIHGFRYNCDALVRILDKKNHGVDFNGLNLKTVDADTITDLVIEKINRSSALWQQFGFLGDVLVLDLDKGKGKYLESLPRNYIHKILCKDQKCYFIFTLEYGTRHFDPFGDHVERINRFDFESAEESDFLHPVIRKCSEGKIVEEIHLIEDFASEFNREEHIGPLRKFLESSLGTIGTKDIKGHKSYVGETNAR